MISTLHKPLKAGVILSIFALVQAEAASKPLLKKLRDENGVTIPEADAPIAVAAGISALSDSNQALQANQAAVVDAVKNNDTQALGSLINNGVNVNFIDAEDNSPLSYAVAANNTDLANQLLAAGANPNVNKVIVTAYANGNRDLVKSLISYGANPNVRNDNGESLYHLATQANDTEMAELFAANGANTNLPDAGRLKARKEHKPAKGARAHGA